MSRGQFEYTSVDDYGRSVRHGFVITVSNGKGGSKVWGEQIFQTWEAASATGVACLTSRFDVVPAREIIHFGRNPKSHAFHQSILMNGEDDAKMRWYAIRVAPGFQRMAKSIEELSEYRRGESILERNLREANIDVFVPSFWKELRKHRSRKLVERRLPLLVGYAFIRRDPGRGFEPIREIDGVNGVVAVGSVPIAFSETDIQTLMLAAFDSHQAYKFKRETELEGARHNRTKHLNAQLGRLLPKGRSRTVSLRYHAEGCISALSEPLKLKVLGIIAALDGMEDAGTLDEYREAV